MVDIMIETPIETPTDMPAETEEARASGVSWGAIIAGGVAASALTLMLLVFGVGMGFATVSPWSSAGISSTTRSVGAGLYLIVVAMLRQPLAAISLDACEPSGLASIPMRSISGILPTDSWPGRWRPSLAQLLWLR
jgi:hypothetical protein